MSSNRVKSAKLSASLWLCLFLILFCCVAVKGAQRQVIASQDNFQYTGRIDFRQPQTAIISWPGTRIQGAFTGTQLAITLDDQWGKNYFNVFIDDETEPRKIIACQQGKHRYLIADDLADKAHTFTLFKRTEGEEGRTKFLGISLSEQGELLPPPAKPTRKIEFFGDSVTSGMGNEAKVGEADHIPAEKNNYLAYGAITARDLDAEYVSISQSGIGVMVSWFDFTMPQFYDQLDAVGNNDTKWNFQRWQPDVVVVNLLQNDSWLIDREERLQPKPSEEDIVAAYRDFLGDLRNIYPNTYIIAALGSMDATKPGSKWPSYIERAVEQIKQTTGEQKMATFFFPYTGFEQHPRVVQHRKNAALLSAFIKTKMNWQ
ncbi:MAG TPA: electron transporter RnfD [Pseudoalteromonas prydzensis]|uniref:Electron transporter RnfD n=1 Tax=Pseudoalteromonas prydzensis TaxID=182141 RepID=A0A7V1D0M3_9GAMM|nr:SGNH/GDSL hydrolase family protein [Pseudoalteromonas prydzensis]HEA17490.1 electron transporter RnfD [Pseudoalteromonas prydzensis]